MRSVVITGVSRGLGAALFEEVYDRGARVIALGRHFTDSQRKRAAANPDRVILRHTDLADLAALPRREELAAPNGTAASLIVNAAVIEPLGAAGTLDADAISAAVMVNLAAPMLLVNTFLSATRECGEISIVFISSGASRHPPPGWSVYSATKAGGAAFFAALAAEHADDPRIRITAVEPGMMHTDMQARIRAAGLPGSDRFTAAFRRGELTPPARVARRIADAYLDERANRS